MKTNRVEAFSDGVLAIIITIMVLELKVPLGTKWEVLKELVPVVLTYLFSFIYIGIYWNNHHHLMYAVEKINGNILWANLHLLFWLSLLPFATGWMGENHFETNPVAFYGFILLMSAVSWRLLVLAIIAYEGKNSKLKLAFKKDHKGKWSILLYLIGVATAFFYTPASLALYILVAIIWFIPDTRIEKALENRILNPE
ncbi:MAG TPA: TMEM175 family protein [Sediminibacterium sp.]|nr:TMEM175 family protein [Sediminibacterium sp.]